MAKHPQRARASVEADGAVRSYDRWIAPVVLLCFVTSGAASLILESTLTRLLRHVLGNTTLAVTTVLCAFMGGLALGGYLGGRLSERANRPLRAYGLLEGAIGLSCLLLPLAIQSLQPLYHWLYPYVENSYLLLSLVRFTFCGLLLLVPATFMGATLPILSRWYADRSGRPGRAVAWLYTANSLGAAGGVLVCAFVLLPGLGVVGTIRLACLMAMAICLVGLWLNWMTAPGPRDVTASRRGRRPEPVSPPRSRLELALLLAYGLSGAAALVYEVAWTRVLSLVLGSSVYAFSLMLAAFILGLALGSAIAGRFLDRLRDTITGFALVELGIAMTAMAAVPLFGRLPVTIVGIVRDYSHSFALLQAVEFGLVVLIMIVPTTLMGIAFVLVSRSCVTISGRVGHSVGGVYAANTVGAVIGAFTATFVWIPWIGTQNTILLASAANSLIGAAYLLPGLRPLPWRWSLIGLVAAASLAAAAVRLPAWDVAVMNSGGYLHAKFYAPDASRSAEQIRARMQGQQILYHREDICGSVMVREGEGDRALVIGGKTDASLRGDQSTQMLIAHAPLLLHPQPRKALVIGLASGMTLGAATAHPLESIDCVEISPAVVEASRYFNDVNANALSDPRVRLILGDGRNHIALTNRTYDVIISEPSNPWLAGVADLFTLEYFQACRARLNPGGIACVWLQAYKMQDAVFRSVVRTFHEVFPHMVVVEAVIGNDYLLIGSPQPIRVPYADLVRRMGQPALAASLGKVDMYHPLDLIQRISLSNRIGEFTAGAPLHTDDSVMVEFAAPRGLYAPAETPLILMGLWQLRQTDLGMLSFGPADQALQDGLRADLDRRLRARQLACNAAILWASESYDQAVQTVHKALEIEPAGCDPLLYGGRELLRQAMAAQADGDIEEAVRITGRAITIAPHLIPAHTHLADLLAQSGKWADAVKALRMARTRAADNQQVLNDLAWLLATAPDPKVRSGPEALQLAEHLCGPGSNPPPVFQRTLAAAYAEMGRFEDAAAAAAAAELAAKGNDPALARQLQDQSVLYRQGQAFRQPLVRSLAAPGSTPMPGRS
jgi:spermidine synthase